LVQAKLKAASLKATQGTIREVAREPEFKKVRGPTGKTHASQRTK